MYGYIFETTNTKTGDTYLGKRYAVKFDKDYFGEDNNESLAIAIEKYGRSAFEVKMIMPYEDRYAIEMAYNEMLKPKRPEAEPEVEKPKRKKAEEPVVEMPEQKESTREEPVAEEPKPAKRGRKKKVVEDEGK